MTNPECISVCEGLRQLIILVHTLAGLTMGTASSAWPASKVEVSSADVSVAPGVSWCDSPAWRSAP